MRRHWRKTTIAMAGVALVASAVASSACGDHRATAGQQRSRPGSAAAGG